jgi:hypothetical protein
MANHPAMGRIVAESFRCATSFSIQATTPAQILNTVNQWDWWPEGEVGPIGIEVSAKNGPQMAR